MRANIQLSSEPHIPPDSQQPQEDTVLARASKRQKTTHHHQPEEAAIPAAHSLSHSHSPAPSSTMSASETPLLETLHLEHVPETHSVHVAVFRDVANAAFLHQQLLARNSEFEYALIDASVITSRLQVLAAAFRAITAQLAGSLKTPNVHSELVYSLSPTNNIAEAYRRHGIAPTSRDLIIVKVLVTPPASSSSATAAPETTPVTDLDLDLDSDIAAKKPPSTAQDIEKHLLAHVQGTPAPLTDETLAALTDWARVRKYYKLNGVGWLDRIKDPVRKEREMNTLVMGSMALRGV
ncbi:kinase binding protein CGI-121-domain-containing protein [Nemania serpens]|nr:kinase binding protein CGI-121-domain-containing protein [Nemania serpens]